MKAFSWLAWLMWGLSLALLIGYIPLRASSALFVTTADVPLATSVTESLKLSVIMTVEDGFLHSTYMAFSTLGGLIVLRRRGNLVGWVFCAVGLIGALMEFAGFYAIYSLLVMPGSLPAGLAAAWLNNWLWVAYWGLLCTVLPLVFPTGRLLSERWWPVAWFAAGATALMIFVAAFHPGPLFNNVAALVIPNPFGIQALGDLIDVAGVILYTPFLLSMIAAGAALLLRLRRARGEEHEQLKWFAHFASILVAVFLIQPLVRPLVAIWPAVLEELYALILAIAFAGLAIGTWIALLRHRLYNIDIVIHKTVVYGALAALITAVYVSIVAGAGVALGAGTDANPLLPLVAAACVAVVFQPLRQRLERLANRLVYGGRADPYQLLNELAHRLAAALSVEEVLPKMAQTAARAVGATRSQVRVYLPGGDERSVLWPPGGEPGSFDCTIAIAHGGEVIGELAVAKRAGDPISPAEERLLNDLAAQAGLAMRNVRLAAELRARVEEVSAQAAELDASRHRIVAAHDAERRRLERDLHDGAQQHLVVLAMHLRRAAQTLPRDPAGAQVLETLAVQALEIHSALRDLSRGIAAPLLRDQGLVAALEAHAVRAAPPTRIEADPAVAAERLDATVETAVYFCCLEALQNVAKHTSGAVVTVRLSKTAGWLDFSVKDDGRGFDLARAPRGSGLQNMMDRLAALGGSLTVDSATGQGTTVKGRVPVPPAVSGEMGRHVPRTEYSSHVVR